MPYLHVLSSFRDSVREMAREGRPHKDFLSLCDRLRDIDLEELGVSLDDQDGKNSLLKTARARRLTFTFAHVPDGKALVKLIPAATLLAAREAKFAVAAEKAARKAQLAAEKEAALLAKLEKGKIPPEEMFKTPEYSALDEKGIPTHDAEGVELSKGKRKKLIKEWEEQSKLHEKYVLSQK
jgi:cysteinyl-tRNA synthetase